MSTCSSEHGSIALRFIFQFVTCSRQRKGSAGLMRPILDLHQTAADRRNCLSRCSKRRVVSPSQMNSATSSRTDQISLDSAAELSYRWQGRWLSLFEKDWTWLTCYRLTRAAERDRKSVV